MADQTVDSGSQAVLTPQKWRKKLILLFGILLFLVILIGSVAFFAPGLLPEGLRMSKGKSDPEAVKGTSSTIQGHIYNMEPMIVNLADSELPRYLKIKIDIESLEKKPNPELEKRLPHLRDAIITILSSKTYKEIYDVEGKKRLKEEMVLKANQLFDPLTIKTIYFAEFVVQ